MYQLLVKTLLVPTAYARDNFVTELDNINPLGKGATLIDIINRIFTWFVNFAAILAPIIIIWGAFQILTSGGEAEKFKTGKQAIFYTVIGFIIILMAKGIVAIVAEILKGAAA